MSGGGVANLWGVSGDEEVVSYSWSVIRGQFEVNNPTFRTRPGGRRSAQYENEGESGNVYENKGGPVLSAQFSLVSKSECNDMVANPPRYLSCPTRDLRVKSSKLNA